MLRPALPKWRQESGFYMNGTIVVLDAEPIVRSVITKILQRAGYAVHAAGELDAALRVIESEHPDLVITNVSLPGITGHEALRVIRDRCGSVPVLMVSGLPEETAFQEWIGEEGFDTFPKPFKPEDLIGKVRQVLAN
jgi:two-component system, OmpR family, response regulator